MILSFSPNMPWRDKSTGSPIKTDFIPKIHAFQKIHTFRADEKDRWKAGMKIHPYSKNPMYGGTETNFQIQNAEFWFDELTSSILNKTKMNGLPITSTPEHALAVPVLHGFETYKFVFDELGSKTMVRLSIEDVFCFGATFSWADYSVDCGNKAHRRMLELISENDGLSPSDFLRWFIHQRRKAEKKVLTGKILHWTTHRYFADVDADPFTPTSGQIKLDLFKPKFYTH